MLRNFALGINQAARQAVLNWLNGGSKMLLGDIEITRNRQLETVRNYYDGIQDLRPTPRQKAWLDQHGQAFGLSFNHCSTVVDALVERLKVQTFKYSGNNDALEKRLWQYWQQNRMDAIQSEIHRAAVRDGEAFLMIEWNQKENRPEWIFHPRYAEIYQKGGSLDAYGVWMEYPFDDYLQPAIRAIKQWQDVEERNGTTFQVTRRTIYYPEKIERWIRRSTNWEPYKVKDEEWPLPWLDKDSKPLGIPVIHFKQPQLASELQDIVIVQDALNKVWLDILAASDSEAFRTILTRGFFLTSDGKEPNADASNVLPMSPGGVYGTAKAANMTAVDVIDPSDLGGLLDLEVRLVFKIASISSTPLSRFQSSKQVASDETLKEQDAPLLAKIAERHTLFGNAWEDVCIQSLKQENTFGEAGSLPKELESNSQHLTTVWASPEVRIGLSELQIAQAKRDLGIPLEQVLKDLGYTTQQITEIMNNPETKARMENMISLSKPPMNPRGNNANNQSAPQGS
jgi:hypothetical protein